MINEYCEKRGCGNESTTGKYARVAICDDHKEEANEIHDRLVILEEELPRHRVQMMFELYGANPWYVQDLVRLCVQRRLVPAVVQTGCVHKLHRATHQRIGSACYERPSWDAGKIDHIVWLRADVPDRRRAPWALLTQPSGQALTIGSEPPEWADIVEYYPAPYTQGATIGALLAHTEGWWAK